MLFYEIDGLVGLALLALWLYCIYDVITTDEVLIRHLPKMPWLMIVIFLPDIGSIIWLIAGRPEKASFRPGGTTTSSFWKSTGPEDKPGYGAGLDLDSLSPIVREREERAQMRMREEQLRRREEELRRREEALKKGEPPPDPEPDPT